MVLPHGKLLVNVGMDGHRHHQSCSVIAPSVRPSESVVGIDHTYTTPLSSGIAERVKYKTSVFTICMDSNGQVDIAETEAL